MPFQKKVLTHFVTIKDLVRIISWDKFKNKDKFKNNLKIYLEKLIKEINKTKKNRCKFLKSV